MHVSSMNKIWHESKQVADMKCLHTQSNQVTYIMAELLDCSLFILDPVLRLFLLLYCVSMLLSTLFQIACLDRILALTQSRSFFKTWHLILWYWTLCFYVEEQVSSVLKTNLPILCYAWPNNTQFEVFCS